MKDLIDYSRETGTGPMGKFFLSTPKNNYLVMAPLDWVFKKKWWTFDNVIFIRPDQSGICSSNRCNLLNVCASRLSQNI